MSLAERRDSIGNLGCDMTGLEIVSVIVKTTQTVLERPVYQGFV
jgi:hypothetical protein